MTDTPIIDAAILAGCEEAEVGCVYPECAQGAFKCRPAEIVKKALRAALPWDLSTERLEMMATAFGDVAGLTGWVKVARCKAALSIYRADPLVRELYPEKFT